MDLKELIERFHKDVRIEPIVGFCEKHDSGRILLKGLTGSSSSFIAGSVATQTNCSHIFVLNDKEDAAYFLNDLENVFKEETWLFFPSTYKKPYSLHEADSANILERAEVLNHISKAKSRTLIVTYAEALNEKVVTRQTLKTNTLDVRVGDKIGISFLTDFLTEYGFERTDFVYEAGQFAQRGGILDVYSFANEWPYRIEFFGDEIESIRSFDPADQLSQTKLAFITIIPNVQTTLLEESRESFLDFISDDTCFWFRNIDSALGIMQSGYEKACELTVHPDEAFSHIVPSQMFESGESIFDSLSKFNQVLFGITDPENLPIYNFNTSPQPSFNKNFDLLSQDLKKNISKQYKNIIFSDTPRQVERLHAIFKDIQIHKPGTDPEEVPFFTVLLPIHEGFVDHELKLVCYTDHQIFDRYHRFRLRTAYARREAITLRELYDLKPGDFVTHIDHGIGRFAGLEKMDVNGKVQETIRLVYKDNDILYVSIHALHRISKYTGKDSAAPTLSKLGSNAWSNLKQKAKKRVKDIAGDLIKLYAQRKQKKGYAFAPDTYFQHELEASFIYEDTPDQLKATQDVKKDMERSMPMDRLVCGDVGFGKTEIAIRAAFKAVADSKQVAILVPTTILALQHYNTFRDRLKEFPCTVDYINRFKSAAKQKETLKKLADGKIDIIIGTHRLLGKDVKFHDLGLMIVDEEQKFGVTAKERLKSFKINVHTLTLTATPIPRTLQFSLMGARDLSIMNTPPANRYPVTTEIHTFNEKIIKEAIDYEVSRGGQVFFVHNRIQGIHDIAAMISRICPKVRIGVAHGQMDGDKLEEIMLDFIGGEYDVLVSTSIIENGLDIPNANSIIIDQAHHFGLSDLHQMRGRVGRSNKKSFCYLLAPPHTLLTSEAKQRLRAIEEFAGLGSGFSIALRDLDIRGAGNLLGAEQSGFISEIGFETYQKILDEALFELKEENPGLFDEPDDEVTSRRKLNDAHLAGYIQDCMIDTDMEILIPDEYVENMKERVALYKQIDDLENEDALSKFEENLRDRFGAIPKQVRELLNAVRLRWLAMKIGFEKIVLKNQRFTGYFIANKNSPFFSSPVFLQVMQYVGQNPNGCRIKESNDKLSLIFTNTSSIDHALQRLRIMIGTFPTS